MLFGPSLLWTQHEEIEDDDDQDERKQGHQHVAAASDT
jgi:hypothetical protein